MRGTPVKWIGISVLSLLTACVVLPPEAPSYKPAPEPKKDLATLYIYRQGARPRHRAPSVQIDGRDIFVPPEKAYTWVYAGEGMHRIRIHWAWDLGYPDMDVSLMAEKHTSYFLKISSDVQWHLFSGTTVKPKTVWEDRMEAEEELENCCRYVPPEVMTVW